MLAKHLLLIPSVAPAVSTGGRAATRTWPGLGLGLMGDIGWELGYTCESPVFPPQQERPKSALFPGEGKVKMSVEEQIDRMRRHQSGSMKEKRRSLQLPASPAPEPSPRPAYKVVRSAQPLPHQARCLPTPPTVGHGQLALKSFENKQTKIHTHTEKLSPGKN